MTIVNLHVLTVWHPAPSKQTYEQHFEIFDSHKEVYWGVINKKDEKHIKHKKYLEPFVKRLRDQIKDGKRTYLFITPTDSSQIFLWGEISSILTHIEFMDWKKSKLVPSYYKKRGVITQGREITYWFLLKSFMEITEHNIFQKITRIKDPNDYDKEIEYSREIFGEEGHPFPCLCSFSGEEELGYYLQHNTKYLWRKTGDKWHISFNNKVQIQGDLDGIKYIDCLLRNPYKFYSSSNLYLILKGGYSPNAAMNHEMMIKDFLDHEGLGPIGNDLYDILDEKALQSIKEMEKVLKNRIEKATYENNLTEITETKDLLDKFLKCKNTAVNQKGGSRKFLNENDKARKAVSKAIKYAEDKISDKDPKLGAHLHQCIKKGSFMHYTPLAPTPWQF